MAVKLAHDLFKAINAYRQKVTIDQPRLLKEAQAKAAQQDNNGRGMSDDTTTLSRISHPKKQGVGTSGSRSGEPR